MKLNWTSPITWMVFGALVAIVGALIGAAGDTGESFNPLVAIGGLTFLGGAFAAAIRYGMRKSS